MRNIILLLQKNYFQTPSLLSVLLAIKNPTKTALFLNFFLIVSCSQLSSEPPLIPERTIGIFVTPGMRGEREFSERVRIACNHLNWNIEILNAKTKRKKTLDWTLTLVPGNHNISKDNDYLVLFAPEHHFFNLKGKLFKQHRNYAGYLTTFQNTKLLLKSINGDTKRIYPKRWYPTVQCRPYVQVNPTRLFHMVGQWGDRLHNSRYIELQNKLAEQSYTHFYGKKEVGEPYGEAYKGEIEYDGESILNIISDLGACLVLHSETHLQHNIPSGRIFEAAASSAVIITDLNPFVVENFGDSVFYINQNLSGNEMFEQIDTAMRWIQNNPEKALEMAKKAHQIFEERFLLENQLLDFDSYHQSRKSK